MLKFSWGQKWLWGQLLGAARQCGPEQQLKSSRFLALVSRQRIGVYVAVSEAEPHSPQRGARPPRGRRLCLVQASGLSKAELARQIDRNASSVRRLFTAHQARPELPLITAVAEALGLRIAIVPESPDAKKAVRDHHRGRKELIGA